MRYKYRNYWIKVIKENNKYTAEIWLVGNLCNKERLINNFSLGEAQAKAERYIDKKLSIGGIFS